LKSLKEKQTNETNCFNHHWLFWRSAFEFYRMSIANTALNDHVMTTKEMT